MTGRVCPVHGEYAADGICRWCEAPKRMPTNLPAGFTPCRCGEYSWLPGAVGERNGVIAGVAHSPEVCVAINAAPAIYRPTPADLPIQPPVVLEYQHAALRWERVARRWNYKHRDAGGLDEAGRRYVWRAWLDQQERRREAALIEAGIPKEWP